MAVTRSNARRRLPPSIMAVCCCIRGSGWTRSTRCPSAARCTRSTSAATAAAWPATWPRGRAYDNHDALFRRADSLLFALSEAAVDQILDACPDVGRRPRSEKSQAEQCAVWDDDAEVMTELAQPPAGTPSGSGSGSSCSSAADAPRTCWTVIRPHAQRRRDRAQGGPQRAGARSTGRGWSACWGPRAATRTGRTPRSLRLV